MLAKPEYSSPPDEVCCWQGRRDRAVAGRGAVAELLARSAMAKRMAALWQRAIGKMLLARSATVTEPQGLAADAKMPL